jgi:hypothetical protein
VGNAFKLLAKAASLPEGQRIGWHSFRRRFAGFEAQAPSGGNGRWGLEEFRDGPDGVPAAQRISAAGHA